MNEIPKSADERWMENMEDIVADMQQQDSFRPSDATACPLFRRTWEKDKMEPVETTDLFVWACVNTKTGEVEMTGIQPYDDELNEDLLEDWEWRRFRLVEAIDKASATEESNNNE